MHHNGVFNNIHYQERQHNTDNLSEMFSF